MWRRSGRSESTRSIVMQLGRLCRRIELDRLGSRSSMAAIDLLSSTSQVEIVIVVVVNFDAVLSLCCCCIRRQEAIFPSVEHIFNFNQ